MLTEFEWDSKTHDSQQILLMWFCHSEDTDFFVFISRFEKQIEGPFTIHQKQTGMKECILSPLVTIPTMKPTRVPLLFMTHRAKKHRAHGCGQCQAGGGGGTCTTNFLLYGLTAGLPHLPTEKIQQLEANDGVASARRGHQKGVSNTNSILPQRRLLPP